MKSKHQPSKATHNCKTDSNPTPSLHGVVTRPFAQQASNLIHLLRKHGLDALRMCFELSVKGLALLLQLLVHHRELLRGGRAEIRNLSF